MIYNKDKYKNVSVHNVATYRGISYRTPLILNLTTRWKQVANFILRPFYPQEMNPVSVSPDKVIMYHYHIYAGNLLLPD